MKKICSIVLLLSACSQHKSDVNDILKTDKEFSAMCMKQGMSEAFIYYAAEDVIKMRPYEFPIMNKAELQRMFNEHSSDGNLKFGWEPVKADISSSGDLGYTFGNWKIFVPHDSTHKDTTLFGNYVSIWKKQSDGSWKYVLDGGNSTPAQGME
jgi:ketosteroid isomerase-like protein